MKLWRRECLSIFKNRSLVNSFFWRNWNHSNSKTNTSMGFIFQGLPSLCCHASAKYSINNYQCRNIAVGTQSPRVQYKVLSFPIRNKKRVEFAKFTIRWKKVQISHYETSLVPRILRRWPTCHQLFASLLLYVKQRLILVSLWFTVASGIKNP